MMAMDGMVMMDQPPMAMMAAGVSRLMSVPAPGVTEMKKPSRVRKLFPETWLWNTKKDM